MTPEQLTAFKEALIQACDSHIANGGGIVAGAFYQFNGHSVMMCPVSCLTKDIRIKEEDSFSYSHEYLSQKLGFTITAAEMWSFIDGFDGWVRKEYQETNKIGTELRAKYITKEQVNG